MSASVQHQQLVRALINHFENNLKFQIIAAALPGFTPPLKLGSHIPDIVARDQNGVLQLGEAELGQDLTSEQTAGQFRELSCRVMKQSYVPVPLHIIVFRQDYQVLFSRLLYLGLLPKIGNRIKIWTV